MYEHGIACVALRETEERDFMQVFTSVLNVPGPKIVNCLVARRQGD
jgi:hypothetical protein